MPQRRHLVASAIIVLLLALVPLAGSRYAIDLTTEVLIYVLFALSLNVLIGFTGNISFGHAAYFAIGGYACARVGRLRSERPSRPVWSLPLGRSK